MTSLLPAVVEATGGSSMLSQLSQGSQIQVSQAFTGMYYFLCTVITHNELLCKHML